MNLEGDLVAVTQAPHGVLITPQEVIATRALDRIGTALREQGVSLEELIESGRAIRGELIQEQYGHPRRQASRLGSSSTPAS